MRDVNAYVVAAIVLFGLSSVLVLIGVTGQHRHRMRDDGPNAVGANTASWLAPALVADAIGVALLLYGLGR